MEGEERSTALIIMIVLMVVALVVFIVFALISSKDGGFSLKLFGSYAKALIGLFK